MLRVAMKCARERAEWAAQEGNPPSLAPANCKASDMVPYVKCRVSGPAWVTAAATRGTPGQKQTCDRCGLERDQSQQ
ncbi:hypothetical protein QF002_001060 [Paraburkholderia youngii]